MPSIALVLGGLGDLLDQRVLALLERDFGEHDRAALAALLDLVAAADDDRAAAGLIGRAAARAAEDHRAGREVRPGHDLHQLLDRDRAVFDIGQAGVDHFAQVMRRDVGRHADRDAAGAVDQQVGEAGGEDRRLAFGAVVIVLEIDRVLVDDRRAARSRPWPAAPRCSASPPADRDPSTRNCPGRRSAARASTSPAPCAPSRRRSSCRRADGIYPSRRRRGGRTCDRAGRRDSRLPARHSRMRRWTGFSPSRTSGSARATITLIA